MSRHPASSTSWKKTNHRQSQQKAMSDPTAKARRSFADRKTSSRPPPDGQPPRRSVADRKNSSGPKPDGQPKTSVADKKNFSAPKPDRQPRRRRIANGKPKTSLFGTDSLQC